MQFHIYILYFLFKYPFHKAEQQKNILSEAESITTGCGVGGGVSYGGVGGGLSYGGSGSGNGGGRDGGDCFDGMMQHN